MSFVEIDADDEYDKCCGEMYLTIKGTIVFHCTLCTLTCTGYEMYENHVRSEHLLSQEVDYNDIYLGNECENVEILDESDYINNSCTVKQDTSDKEFSENEFESEFLEEDENLLEKLLEYNEMQEKRKHTKVESDRKQTSKKQLKTVSNSNKRSGKSLRKSTNISNAFTERQQTLPSCDRPQLKQLRSLSSALTDKERKHKCPYCVFASKDKTNLWSHIQRHSNNKPHKCDYCPKSFHTRTELIFHTRYHTGERPYLCDDCGRAFVTKQQLKQHIKRHRNERDYECSECKKRFFSSQELQGHMTVHTKETPFKCDTCERVFTRRKALYAHRKIHENKKSYKCQICGIGYNQGAGLYLHMKSKHKVVKNKEENKESEGNM